MISNTANYVTQQVKWQSNCWKLGNCYNLIGLHSTRLFLSQVQLL